MPCRATAIRRPTPAATITRPSRSISRGCSKKSTASWLADRRLRRRMPEFFTNPMKSETDPPPTAQSQSSTAEPTWSSRLSRIRHDLRNPLSEILGFSEILQEEAAERGLQQLLPGFGQIHQAASRIFGEVNHWLNPDTIRMTPESVHELERTVQSLSQRIISTAENLSEKCDELENNWVGDDLLRIEGAARKLQDLA